MADIGLKTIELKGVETWREYDWHGRVYRIQRPVRVQYRDGGATHRVTDMDGVVHCVPAPGTIDCVLRWQGMVIA